MLGFARIPLTEMAAISSPPLRLIACLDSQELGLQVTYLKTENKILCIKLPDRIQLNNQERRRLLKHGLKLGVRIKDLISVASYSTFRKWTRAMEDGPEIVQRTSPVSRDDHAWMTILLRS